jgi:hypothetical protein
VTRFQILYKDADKPDWWIERGTEDAHSAKAAVRQAYLKKPSSIAVMVAVPARSWKPTPIRTETVTKVVLGERPPPTEKPPPKPRVPKEPAYSEQP